MKRKERHQLKENAFAHMLGSARETVGNRGREIGLITLAVLVLAGVALGVNAWRQRGNADAERMLADAMVTFNARVVPVSTEPTQPGEVPAAASIGATGSFATVAAKLNAAAPKLKAAADAFPDSDAGITARYHYGSSMAALGKYDDAVAAFDDVVSRAGADSLYGRMARLGKADTQVRAGQFDASIASWQELASSPGEDLPKDAMLMELARAYEAAGRTEEAQKTFNQLVDEHPTSPYSAEARAELGS
jgi:TolA-binding protein